MLEARFHPRRKGQSDSILLGYLVWRRDRRRERPVFEAARAALSDPMLSKLRYLLAMTAPDSYEGLQALRSEFWSFVRVND